MQYSHGLKSHPLSVHYALKGKIKMEPSEILTPRQYPHPGVNIHVHQDLEHRLNKIHVNFLEIHAFDFFDHPWRS
jgi:hypothetical protein